MHVTMLEQATAEIKFGDGSSITKRLGDNPGGFFDPNRFRRSLG